MRNSTPESLKIINKQAILSQVFNEKMTTRVEITNRTQLSKATVSTIVDELIKEKILIEKGEGASTKQGGRKPINLIINPDAFYIVGLDIGAYKTLFVITDASGKILIHKKILTETISENYDLMTLIKKVKIMIKESGLEEKIIGIGVGIPGTTDIEKGIALSAPKFNWNQVPVKEMMEKEIGIEVSVDNDVNMGVLGEKWLGKGKNCSDFVFVSVGYAIGSGIMLDNKIHRGKNYNAGEIGYMALARDAFKNRNYTFDTYGYFESIASGSAIEKKSGLSCEEVFNRKEKGKVYDEIINEMTDYLSMGISNLIDVLNPEAVILGGGVSKAGEKVLLPIIEKVRQLTPVPCQIDISELGEESGVMGCVATVLSNKYGIIFY